MTYQDDLLKKINELRIEGRSFALATVVRVEPATASRPGDKAIIEANGTLHGWVGGNCSRTALVKTAQQVISAGCPRLIRVSPREQTNTSVAGIIDFGSSCPSGGIMDIFVEPVLTKPVLFIFGDSPVANTLATLAIAVGFSVTPVAENFCADDASLQQPRLAVVANQGRNDLAAIEAALKLEPIYLGFIASHRKASKLKEELIQRGYSEHILAVIDAPAGIDIRAETPEEIALSVLAGVVLARNRQNHANWSITANQ